MQKLKNDLELAIREKELMKTRLAKTIAQKNALLAQINGNQSKPESKGLYS